MGLPNYRIEIRKVFETATWSNDYLVEATTMDQAAAIGLTLKNWEKSFHLGVVHFTYVRCSTMLKYDRVFRHTPYNDVGAVALGSLEPLPLWNTLRFDMATGDSDPCRKYFRVPLYESLTYNGNLDSGFTNGINASFATALAALPSGTYIVSSKGHRVVSGSCYTMIQERQLHRHRRKKVTVPA